MLKQNIVFVENKAGSLRKVTACLAENNINIYAFACFDAPEFAIFRMVSSDPELSEKVLTELGYMNRVTNIIAVDLNDKVGSLDEFLSVFEQSNVSLDYVYTSHHRKDQIPVIIVSCEEIFEAESVLESRGFRVLKELSDLDAPEK
jgi:hypothetical protein